MKSSDAIIKASAYYQSHDMPVIEKHAGVSPRIVAYDKMRNEMILVIIRRQRSKRRWARRKTSLRAVNSLLKWKWEWEKINKWKGSVRLESIAVYESGEMDCVFHGK